MGIRSSTAPHSQSSADFPLIDVLVLLTSVLIVSFVCYKLIPALPDDSYIYLRIANNINAGRGWLYNAGEYTNPATSMTYTVILTILGSIIGFGSYTLVVCYGMTLYLLFITQYFGWRQKGYLAALTIAAATTFGARLLESVGMEVALLMALVSLTSLSYRTDGDSFRTGLLAGLVTLTRPEGIIIVILVTVFHFFTRKSFAWRTVSVASAMMVSWLAFSYFYFGTIVPHTAEIKSLQRHYGYWEDQPDFIYYFVNQSKYLPLTFLLVAIGTFVAIKQSIRGDSFALICIAFGFLQVIGYQILDAPGAYFWYLVPGDFAADLAIFVLFVCVLQKLTLRYSLPKGSLVILTLIVTPVLMRASFNPIAKLPGEYRYSDEYKYVAKWIRDHSGPNDSIAATEIGYIGWFSSRPILDIHGLVHRRSLPWLRAKNLHWWWDEGERPLYVVIHNPVWEGEPGSPKTWPTDLSTTFFSTYNEALRYRGILVYRLKSQT